MSTLPPPNDADIESRAVKMFIVWSDSREVDGDWQTLNPNLADAWRAVAKLDLEKE